MRLSDARGCADINRSCFVPVIDCPASGQAVTPYSNANHHIYPGDLAGINSSKLIPQLGQLLTVGFSLPPACAARPNRARHRRHFVMRSAKKTSERDSPRNSKKTTIATSQGICPIPALAPTMEGTREDERQLTAFPKVIANGFRGRSDVQNSVSKTMRFNDGRSRRHGSKLLHPNHRASLPWLVKASSSSDPQSQSPCI